MQGPVMLSNMTPSPSKSVLEASEEQKDVIATAGVLAYDKESRVLRVSNLNINVQCPMAFEISWS